MMTASIYGRLGRDPKEIATRTGKLMAVVTVAVDISRQEQEETAWIDLICFGGLAEKLLRHHKGEMVSASGRMALNHWTDGEGNERQSWKLVADNLVSARTVRPGGRKRKATPPAHDPAPFNDPMPI